MNSGSQHFRTHLFKIVSWNANGGLNKKKPEIIQFIKDYSPDVFLIQETHLSPSDNFTLPNFHIYRQNRSGPHRGGGTLTAVRRTIPHTPLVNPPLAAIEATSVEIGTPHGAITVVSGYKRPQIQLEEADLDALLTLGQNIIIAGDLNAKHTDWGCRVRNSAGERLLPYLNGSDRLVISPPSSITHLRTDMFTRQIKGDILDIVLHSPAIQITTPKPLHDLTSDHLPILFAFHRDQFPSPTPTKTNYETNWTNFKTTLNNKLLRNPDLDNPTNIDRAINHLNYQILTAFNENSKRLEPHHPTSQTPVELIRLIQERRKAQRAYQRSHDPDAKAAYQTIRRKTSRLLREHRNAMWEKYVENSQINNASDLWKLQRVLRNPQPATTALNRPNNLPPTYDPAVKSEIFATLLEERFTPPPISFNLPATAAEIPISPTPLADIPPDWKIETDEVSDLLSNINTNRSGGPDKLSAAMLKQLPRRAATLLASIFSACISVQYFPTVWKSATVTLLPKPGKNLRFPENYRPISLLPILGKLLERLILNRIRTVLENRGIIRESQFGFRKNRSSALQALRFTFCVSSSLARRCSIPALFFDYSFAFDTVHHPLLIHKLRPYVPPFILNLLISYLTSRNFSVRYQNFSSSTRPILAGVPQGAVLSPFLFSLFLNDAPTITGVQDFIYADDIAFTVKDSRINIAVKRLQRAANALIKWSAENGLTLNAQKCQAIIFSHKLTHNTYSVAPIRLNDHTIPWRDNIKYLGVTFDRRLTWKTHISNARNIMTRRISSLLPLFKSRALKDKIKLHLYLACIRSAGLYACESWATAPETSLNYLSRAENYFIRLAFHPPPGTILADELTTRNIKPMTSAIHELATERIQDIFTNIDTHPLFQPFLQYYTKPSRHKKKKLPSDVIFLKPP